MKLKKRKKSSRYRGSHTHGRGFKKKARGKGNQGGKGMAGSGKRADHKKTLILVKYGTDYFGKDKVLRRKPKPKPIEINIRQIVENLPSLIKEKKAVNEKDAVKINLKGYKILSEGELNKKLIITASAASGSAVEKVKKAGGEIQLEN